MLKNSEFKVFFKVFFPLTIWTQTVVLTKSNYVFYIISAGLWFIQYGIIRYNKLLCCLHSCLPSVSFLTANIDLMLFLLCSTLLAGTTKARPFTWNLRTTQRLAVSSAQWGPMRWAPALYTVLLLHNTTLLICHRKRLLWDLSLCKHSLMYSSIFCHKGPMF